jgi:hypothetical protein
MKNISAILILICTSFSLFSCEDLLQEQTIQREYLIEKGQHHASNSPVRMFNGDRLSVDVKFNSCAVYQTQEPSQQSSTNKLIGFSDFGSHHHQNSARLGWKWLNEKLEIVAYCYVDGERIETFVGYAQIGTFHHFEIQVTDSSYLFFMDDQAAIEVERKIENNTGARYMLWPYFGGQETAPHDIRIEMVHY